MTMTCLCRWIGCRMLLLACLAACQPSEPMTQPKPAKPVATPELAAAAKPPPAAIDWAKAGDCRGMLGLLKRGLDGGRIVGLDDTPFLLIHDGPAAAGNRWSAFGRRFDPVSDIASSPLEARCILRVSVASARRSDHRVLNREQVRSRYQSGTRREKNPAYEVAKVRLRQAEKAAKPGKSSITKVGDPLIDLVGTLVGGALTGFGQWGAGDQLEEALDTMMATPPSIEHPKYRTYHFERARVRAGREATLSVNLTDRQLQRSWQASLKRRERRELFLVTGLDRQDEDYARHSQDSLTEDGLRQWLAEAPSPPLADIVAVLLARSSTAPIDRLALADPPGDPPGESAGEATTVDDAAMDAAVLPPPGWLDAGRSASEGSALTSRITVVGGTARTEGIYIAPHFILTPSDVVGERSLVDVESGQGHVALGLVAAIDHGLGLALIQAPTPGRPVVVESAAQSSGMTGHVSPISSQRLKGQVQALSPSGARSNEPLLVNGRLVGFKTIRGPDIESDAIQIFLDQQRHLLPTDP
ncbi:MAG: hypothetical protein ACR2P3_14510 [Geminicoccaceae bacterium]